MTTFASAFYRRPEGLIHARFTVRGLCSLMLPISRADREPLAIVAGSPWSDPLGDALARYFHGEREDFAEIPTDIEFATPFQREVWTAARRVGWGQTSTYGELAESLGRPKSAARAVGHALGANPIAIVIPCHRFLAANGDLTGFAAGLEWKRELLRLEGSLLA